MQQLLPQYPTQLTSVLCEQAPYGSYIIKTSSANGRLMTNPKPISATRIYRLRGWIRRTSGDETPALKYFIGALLLNYQKESITSGRWCQYYPIIGEGNELIHNLWKEFYFDIGKNTMYPLPQNAKHLSLACVVNLDDYSSNLSTATYQFCGFEVIQIV